MRPRKVLLTGVVSSLLAVVIVLMGFMPQMAQARAIDRQTSRVDTLMRPLPQSNEITRVLTTRNTPSYTVPQGLGIDLQALLDATTDLTDTDGDGLPDSVERVLGTDPENPDSDFDKLDDYREIVNDLDPMEPDSNHDGLADYYEVNDVPSPDIDADGIPNGWDSDNDGDGVNDASDLSPSFSSNVSEKYHFDITTGGNPTCITFQLIPGNREHLKLFGQVWDWPDNDVEGSFQDRDNSKEDVMVFPLLKLAVNSPPAPGDVVNYGITVIGNDALVPLIPVKEHGDIVAFAGRMVYPSTAPQDLAIDARLIWKVTGKNDPDPDNLSQDTLLITYKDSFKLTGMTVEESRGTDAGLLSSPDINQMVAANLLLAYQFLRNSENHIDDVPGILSSGNINVSQQFASFGYRDAALVSIANDMVPEALDLLPDGRNLPVLSLLEDSFIIAELSEFQAISSDNFSVDLTTLPLRTSRTLKESWYNTSDSQILEIDGVMAAINDLGLSEDAASSLMTLMLYWNTGEQRLEGPGIPPVSPGADFDQATDIVEGIIGDFGLVELAQLGYSFLDIYKSVELFYSKGWKSALKGLEDIGKYTKLVHTVDSVKDTSRFSRSIEFAGDALDTVLAYADAGLAAYKVIQIAQMTDLNSFQMANEVLTVTMEYYYGIVLTMIGAIPYVGWLIALGIELSDLLGDWSGDAAAWFAGLFTGVEAYMSPTVETTDPSITIDDPEGNGLNVGDRILLESTLKVTLNRVGGITPDADLFDVDIVSESQYYPYYNIITPAGSNSQTEAPYSQTVNIKTSKSIFDPGTDYTIPITVPSFSHDTNAGWKTITCKSGMWVTPGTAMPNFPIYVQTNTYHELWYTWSYFLFLVFYWTTYYYDEFNSGPPRPTALGGFTYYVDVMPATIADFARWGSIVPLDHDGDGLKDSQETASNPWLYDTDGDGLSDKYETDTGTDPSNYDTDQDGLPDAAELKYNTDPHNADTDGDGLKDGLEVSGWVITFTCGGQELTMKVTSDPEAPDSDGDGVDDATEYWSDLNPRSGDTNGDGIKDVANSNYVATRLQLEKAWGFAAQLPIDSGPHREFRDFVVDAQENVYVLLEGNFVPCVYKYDSNGTTDPDNPISPVRQWWTFGDANLSYMALDPTQDRLLLSVYYATWVSDLNGDNLTEWRWRTGGLTDVDSDGNVYVAPLNSSEREYPLIQTESKIYKYSADATLITTWGGLGSGPDQFQNIKDIAVDSANGYLYIIDKRTDYTRIARFSTDGAYLNDLPDSIYSSPKGIAVDNQGNVYVANTGDNTILKFNADGVLTAIMGEPGDEDGKFNQPFAVKVNDNGDVYVADRPSDWAIGRVQKFSQVTTATRPEIPSDVPDRDGDGLTNDVETAGWQVTFTDATGTHTIDAASDPLLIDTDLDGLTDFQEYELATNPRDPDTDHDGLSDFAECLGFSPQTDPKHFDTDGDGLPDGVEISYGSDPNAADTDGEGLSDFQEFNLGSNPRKGDTDGDGLNDAAEKARNSNLKSADSDGDFVFDGEEVKLGTDPNNADTDSDGLTDGQEVVIYDTDPRNSDSDGDGLNDGREAELGLDPKSGDTDGDGVPDGTEIEQGTNPFMEDSDHDRVPDGKELGNAAPVVNAGPDATINEDDTFTGSGYFTDPDSESWYAGVDYGDGSGLQPLTLNPDKTFALSHVYSDSGTYTLKVMVFEDDGGVGSDNITVTVNEPEYITVTIDIKPDSDSNPINLKGKGVIPVAILTTPDFDATTVDPLSVRFGPGEAHEAHNKGHFEDVDRDGDMDMVLHFEMQDTGIKSGDVEAVLIGMTKDGRDIRGTDSISIVPR